MAGLVAIARGAHDTDENLSGSCHTRKSGLPGPRRRTLLRLIKDCGIKPAMVILLS